MRISSLNCGRKSGIFNKLKNFESIWERSKQLSKVFKSWSLQDGHRNLFIVEFRCRYFVVFKVTIWWQLSLKAPISEAWLEGWLSKDDGTWHYSTKVMRTNDTLLVREETPWKWQKFSKNLKANYFTSYCKHSLRMVQTEIPVV